MLSRGRETYILTREYPRTRSEQILRPSAGDGDHYTKLQAHNYR